MGTHERGTFPTLPFSVETSKKDVTFKLRGKIQETGSIKEVKNVRGLQQTAENVVYSISWKQVR